MKNFTRLKSSYVLIWSSRSFSKFTGYCKNLFCETVGWKPLFSCQLSDEGHCHISEAAHCRQPHGPLYKMIIFSSKVGRRTFGAPLNLSDFFCLSPLYSLLRGPPNQVSLTHTQGEEIIQGVYMEGQESWGPSQNSAYHTSILIKLLKPFLFLFILPSKDC